MVFLTLVQAMRRVNIFPVTPLPDQFWKSRRLFRLTGHLYGRRRNCYRTAIRALHHVLEDTRMGRAFKKRDTRMLWETRIHAAASEHGISGLTLREALPRCHIFLNRQVLTDLAIWEPRTFKALTDVAKSRAQNDDDLNYRNKNLENLDYFASKRLLK